MKIAIIGSRGVPNNYGGFEQFAEMVAVLLVKAGHDVTVYNPHYHEYNEPTFQGVKIQKIYNPEEKIGSPGVFIYDYLSMVHASKSKFDIQLYLGYATSSIFYPFVRKRNSIWVTNMDGLEWKRDKWSPTVKKITVFFEKLGVKYSDYLVSDNREIRNYFLNTYQKDSTFIAYGATLFNSPDTSCLKEYELEAYNYDMLVARLEKENNIETILDGYLLSSSDKPMLVIGNHKTPYGELLKAKYANAKDIRFLGGLYNLNLLDNLRWHSRYYFHGHSVGGTNPSLLEAMASGAFIMAHNNLFNRDVLGENAFYFDDAQGVANIIDGKTEVESKRTAFIQNNKTKIDQEYNWQKIADEYETMFKHCLSEKRK
jgi:glycosyltransferase involved in cell wall biosynthesis